MVHSVPTFKGKYVLHSGELYWIFELKLKAKRPENNKMIPENYKYEDHCIYGMHKEYPNLLEIKFHNPKKKNAYTSKT